MGIMNNIQVKSKQRVTDHGEVLTHHREVTAMLDLVKEETERIDSRFLEPACGNGNFLAEILRRKLSIVDFRYSKSQSEWELYGVMAISSIYGIDILEDNAQECRDRLIGIFIRHYSERFESVDSNCIRSATYIINKNIIHGNALDFKNPINGDPIIFTEWTFVQGPLIKRREYSFERLLKPRNSDVDSLFSDMGEEAFVPNPINELPLINYLELGEHVE
jgi:hypothetical protein